MTTNMKTVGAQKPANRYWPPYSNCILFQDKDTWTCHAKDIQGFTLRVGQHMKCTTKHAGTQCTSRPCKQRLAWRGQWCQSCHAYKCSPVEENTLFTIFLNELSQIYFSRQQFPMQVFWFIISIICSTWKTPNKYLIVREFPMNPPSLPLFENLKLKD